MPRPTHPKKEIESAVRFALVAGWSLKMSNGHIWGLLSCPDGGALRHRIAVFSTPPDRDVAAKVIKRAVLRCQHGMEEKI